MRKELLNVKNLQTVYHTDEGDVYAVDNVSFKVYEGETLAIVGESGSGKSQTAFSLLGLIPSPPGEIKKGTAHFLGKDLLNINKDELRKIRGNEISIIFQEPMTSLNPVHTVGKQIAEVLMLHKNMNKKEAFIEAEKMLELVGIPDANQRVNEYPHQLSGGMRQRVMIAIALACEPKLLIADEPTTALDVTIQAQILDEMEKFKSKMNMSIILITHDLGVVAEMADRVVVMYGGQVVESNNINDLFLKPKHPYTIGLLSSIPKLDEKTEWLNVIEGTVPDPLSMPKGCRFNPRCPYAKEKCKTQMPELTNLDSGASFRCFYPHNIDEEESYE
jgi:peptide/nickel transport system ATP-binding protein/oligopeptide transport system ATP-binding protein